MIRSALFGVMVGLLFIAAISLTHNISKGVTTPSPEAKITPSPATDSDPAAPTPQSDQLSAPSVGERNDAAGGEGARLTDFVKLLASNHKRSVCLDPGQYLGARQIPGLMIADADRNVDLKKTLSSAERTVNEFLQTFHSTFAIHETDGVLDFVVTADLPSTTDDPIPVVEIAGTVRDSKNAAQSGMLVEIRNGHRTSFVTTDSAGRFRIKTRYDSHWGLLITAKDETTGQFAGKLLPAQYGTRVTSVAPIELEMKPGKMLTIEVVDAEKSPVSKANVGVIVGDVGNYLLQSGVSDEQGRARFSLPEDVRIYQVFAIAAGKGADFNSYPAQVPAAETSALFNPELQLYGSLTLPHETRTEWKASSAQPKDTVQLVLFGARRIVMKVQDEQGRPLPGVGFHPWYLEKSPGEQPSLNFSMAEQIGREVTNDQGMVVFDWIPESSRESQVFFHGSPDFISRYVQHNATESNDQPMLVTLEKPVEVSGQVFDVDGQPAAGATIVAVGDDFSGHESHVTATAKPDGTYSFKAFPRQVHLIVARSSDGTQMGKIDGVVVPPGPPLAGNDIRLCKTVRVFGRLTVEDGSKPAPGVKIEIEQQGTDLRQFKGVAFSRPMSDQENSITGWTGPDMKHTTTTDDDGRFEMRLCHGEYSLWPPSVATNSHSITIYEIEDDQDIEIEFDFQRGYWKQINSPDSTDSEVLQ